MDVPVDGHEIADEVQALGQFSLRPARQVTVDPADQGRAGHDAVLPLHPVVATPLPKLPHKGIGNFPRQLPPVLPIAVGKNLRKLRYRKVCEVYQARGVVDDQ